MTRTGSLIFCATLGALLAACGSNANSGNGPTGGSGGTSGDKAVELVPAGNDVSDWTIDTSSNKNGSAAPMVANTKDQAVGLIDGAASPFYKAPFTPSEFVWQNYVNNSLSAAPTGAHLILYIWEMPSADQASQLYAALLQESEYAGNWQPTPSLLGTESRIEDTNTAWWVNFHQGGFYIEVFLSPSYGPGPDFTPSDPDLKQEALNFAQVVAGKI